VTGKLIAGLSKILSRVLRFVFASFTMYYFMNLLETYHQTCSYDTGNNLTHFSHQANSSAWQQTIAIHPNNNRGTETQQPATDFDANGNLLGLYLFLQLQKNSFSHWVYDTCSEDG
jgi:hypothetical protein